MRPITRRLAPLALAAIAFVAPAAASASPGSKAAEWLASQLHPTGSGSYCEVFGEQSVGETIECSLAFKAAGASFNAQREATYKWVLANKSAYVGSEPCATTTHALSAGAVAKLALVVEAQGGNPESVEGRNLIADLKCLQVPSGSEAGRFSDKNQPNFSNVTGQSLRGDRAEGLRSRLHQQTEPESVGRSGRGVPARPAVFCEEAEDAERCVSLDDGLGAQHVQRRAAVRKRK